MKRTMIQFTAFCVAGALVCGVQAQRPGREGGPPGQGPDRPNPLLRLFDADRDGVLSEAEIDNAAAKLKELDTSRDGKLTADEFRELMPFGPGRSAGWRTTPGAGWSRPRSRGRSRDRP